MVSFMAGSIPTIKTKNNLHNVYYKDIMRINTLMTIDHNE
jgi:hypothetical protein